MSDSVELHFLERVPQKQGNQIQMANKKTDRHNWATENLCESRVKMSRRASYPVIELRETGVLVEGRQLLRLKLLSHTY